MNVQELLTFHSSGHLQLQKHPYSFWGSDPEKLILGSAPPSRFYHTHPKTNPASIRFDDFLAPDKALFKPKDLDFYYGSQDNQLWKIMAAVYDVAPINSVKGIQELLQKEGFGICDTLRVFYRRQNSPLDAMLYPVYFRNIFSVIKNNLRIQRIFTTGQQITAWFAQYLSQNAPTAIFKEHTGFIFEEKQEQRSIRVYTLPSPSGNHRVKLSVKIQKYEQLLR